MKLSRAMASRIHFFLDECLPPVLRDSLWFMILPFLLLYRDKARLFLEFKDKALTMTKREFHDTYQSIESVLPERETDLTDACVDKILDSLVGRTVLEVGCGKCFLAEKMSKDHQVTASDIVVDPELATKYPSIKFREADVGRLPFNDKAFDTVVCANTLEHVPDISTAIDELRRVARRRLIVVVPKQRQYQYTFDLHLHFFPYMHSLLMLMRGSRKNHCEEVEGSLLFYFEDK